MIEKKLKRWIAQLLSDRQEVDKSIFKPLAKGGDDTKCGVNYSQLAIQNKDCKWLGQIVSTNECSALWRKKP